MDICLSTLYTYWTGETSKKFGPFCSFLCERGVQYIAGEKRKYIGLEDQHEKECYRQNIDVDDSGL